MTESFLYEDDDDRYVHVGGGVYKEKDGKGEALPNSPSYLKKDSGGFEMVDPDDPRLSKGKDDKKDDKPKGKQVDIDPTGGLGGDSDGGGVKDMLKKNPEKLDDMDSDELQKVFSSHEEYKEFEKLRNLKVLKDKHSKLYQLTVDSNQAEQELESLEQEQKQLPDPYDVDERDFENGKQGVEDNKKKWNELDDKIKTTEQKIEDAYQDVSNYQQDNEDVLDADKIPYQVADLVRGEEKKKDESIKVINGKKYKRVDELKVYKAISKQTGNVVYFRDKKEMDAAFKAKKIKKEAVKESVNKRITVKEVKSWLKGLEEFRYRKIPSVDARRITSFVNNGLSETDLPASLQKKWGNAKYSREKHLADKFVKERISKKLARNESNHPLKEQYNRLFKNKVVL